ncbi:MAG: enoyl-CoA hydratase/isomerase family protein [Alphaproteobacteria bacterium]
MSVPLLLERRDAVAIISINDAPRNRMSLEFMDQLEGTLRDLAVDNTVRALVFTAEGTENFSVGMNLKQLPEGIQAKGSVDGLFDQRLRVLEMIERMGKPSVVTLFGYCLGGGLELPLACHFRLAAEEGAQIGLPEMDLGTVPAWGGSARLARCVGRDHALDMILRAKKISGPEALRIGLVNEVWPLEDLKDRAISLAQEVAAMPRLAVKGVMDCIVGHETKSLHESLADERRAVHLTMGTPDAREGIMAFLEKRRPLFNQDD